MYNNVLTRSGTLFNYVYRLYHYLKQFYLIEALAKTMTIFFCFIFNSFIHFLVKVDISVLVVSYRTIYKIHKFLQFQQVLFTILLWIINLKTLNIANFKAWISYSQLRIDLKIELYTLKYGTKLVKIVNKCFINVYKVLDHIYGTSHWRRPAGILTNCGFFSLRSLI